MAKDLLKRIVSIALIPFQVFGLFGCANNNSYEDEIDNKEQIGIYQEEQIFRVEYLVRNGESLSNIADKFKVDINSIRTLNFIEDEEIYNGQRLCFDVTQTIFKKFNFELVRSDMGSVISYLEYTVEPGDTIEDIASRFGVDVSQIEYLEFLFGEPVIIKGVTNEQIANYYQEYDDSILKYIVKERDTVSAIAKYFGVSIDQISGCEDKSKIKVGQMLFISGVSDEKKEEYYKELNAIEVEYVVASGDTLSKIAETLKVSVKQISGYSNPNRLKVGQKLTVKFYNKEDASRYYEAMDNVYGIYIEKMPDGYLRGIDISKFQDGIDWDVMQYNYEIGIFDYIILRISDSVRPGTFITEFTLDPKFETFLSECNKRNIPYSGYYVVRGSTIDEAKEEVIPVFDYIKNNLGGIKKLDDGTELDLRFEPSLPVFADFGEDNANKQRKLLDNGEYELCVDILEVYANETLEAGYCPGVYYHYDAEKKLGKYLDEVRIGEYGIPIIRWPARYGSDDFAAIERGVETITYSSLCKIGSYALSYQVEDNGIMPGIKDGIYFDVSITDDKIYVFVRNVYDIVNSKSTGRK